jgi:hypothetical protein
MVEGEGHEFAPCGFAGSKPGSPAELRLIRQEGTVNVLPSKVPHMQIHAEERFVHHYRRGQTLMPCSPQYRQRQIWAYQPAPKSSKPSCGVFSPQSRQKRLKCSGRSRNRISLRHARFEAAEQSPSAANRPFQRIPPVRPLHGSGEVKPNWARKLRRVTDRAERAIIASPNDAPTFLHQPCQPPARYHDRRSGFVRRFS